MRKLAFSPTMEFRTPATDEVQFVASITKTLRSVFEVDKVVKDSLFSIAEHVAKIANSHPTLKEELLNDPRAEIGDFVMRQIDVRLGDDAKIAFKAFVSWEKTLDCWHVMLEFPSENVWESGGDNR